MLIKDLFSITICILLSITALFYLVKYPKNRFHKLSLLRNYKRSQIKKYRINSYLDHILNIIIIIIYCLALTGIIFYLRILNKDKTLDLKIYYYIVKDYILNTTIIETLLTGFLYVLVIILYFVIITKIVKYFKFHVIKRHIYYSNTDNHWWYFNFFYDILVPKILFTVQGNTCKYLEKTYQKIYDLFGIKKDYGLNYNKLSFQQQTEICLRPPVDADCLIIKYPIIRKIIDFILKYCHYVILCLVLLYDLYYNNFVITKFFYILPCIFFYDLYIRVSIFIDDLHFPYDENFHLIVYCDNFKVLNKNTVIINGDLRDYNYFKKMYKTYIQRNFVKDRVDLFS